MPHLTLIAIPPPRIIRLACFLFIIHHIRRCLSTLTHLTPYTRTFLPHGNSEPNLESGANIDCCKLYRDNRAVGTISLYTPVPSPYLLHQSIYCGPYPLHNTLSLPAAASTVFLTIMIPQCQEYEQIVRESIKQQLGL